MSDEETVGPVTARVAGWAAGLVYDDIPPDVIEFTKRSILDGIGCAVRGLEFETGALILDYARGLDGGKPDACVWGTGIDLPARAAGLVNATTAHAPNIGDSFNAHPVHTNYLMPQAAIAVAEKEGLSGRDVLAACVAGTEVCLRAAVATDVSGRGGYFDADGRGWQATGALGAIGTSVAAARLLGLDPAKMVQALVLGGTQLAGVYRPSGGYMGKSLFAGKAVAGGIENGYIARTGFVAGYRLYEDGLCSGPGIVSPNYNLEEAAAGLGAVWRSREVDFCIHPAKKTFNANIDSLLEILRRQNLKAGDIARIDLLSAYASAHAHDIFRAPNNSTEAFNNLRYIAAVTAMDGDYWFDQLSEEKYANADILRFASEKVRIVRSGELEKLTDRSWPGGAEIVTTDGQRHRVCFTAHKGEVTNPLTGQELEAKFRRMTERFGARWSDRVIDIVDNLETLGDIRDLTAALRPESVRG